MKKMIHFEIKKLIDRKVIILFLLLFIFNIAYIGLSNINSISSQFYHGKREIIKEVEGQITQDKVDFLLDGLTKNNKLVDEGQYDSEKGDEDTYTGYIYGDMNAFEEVYTDLKRVYDYNNNIDKKVTIINENIAKNNQMEDYPLFLKNKLEGRYITSYYDTEGVQKYLSYSASIIFILFIVLFTGINYLYYDQSFQMKNMISITKNGRFKLKLLRYILLHVFAFIISLIFFLFDYFIFSLLYDISGLWNPIYSLPSFSSTYFDISVFSYVILQAFTKVLIIECVCCFMVLLSNKIYNSYMCMVTCFGVSVITWLNMYKTENHAFSIQNISQTFSTHKILSFFTHDLYLIILSLSLLFMCMSLLHLRKDIKKR